MESKSKAPTTRPTLTLDLENNFFFYRCYLCHGLITIYEEYESAFTGQVCPCGSRRYSPSNLVWYDYLKPRVWKIVWGYWTGKILVTK